MIYFKNCNVIEEYITYKTDVSILSSKRNINEVINVIGTCNNLKRDQVFLNSYLNNKIIYDEKMIVKYWYYMDYNVLLNLLKNYNNTVLLQKLSMEKEAFITSTI